MSMVGPAAIRAYHASPFLFDQFTLNNLRGGTGGLAQGHGLYFAQKEPVSLDYLKGFKARSEGWEPPPGSTTQYVSQDVETAAAKALADAPTPPKWATDLGWSNNAPYPYDVAQNVIAGVQKGDNLAAYRQFVQESGWSPIKKNMYLAAIDAIEPWKFKPGTGHMYEVDIHTDPNRLLGWDQPLRDQPNILDRISGINTVPGSGNAEIKDVISHAVSREERIPLTGEEFYKWLSNTFSGSKLDPAAAAAKTLQDVGIPGNKYLDQFSRNLPGAAARARMQERVASLERSLDPANPYSQPMTIGEIERLKRELAQQPTHNYVISDPERTRIEILRKYGLLPPLAVGAGGGLLGEE